MGYMQIATLSLSTLRHLSSSSIDNICSRFISFIILVDRYAPDSNRFTSRKPIETLNLRVYHLKDEKYRELWV